MMNPIHQLGNVYCEAERNGINPYHAMNNYLVNHGMDKGRAMAVVIIWTCKYGTVSSESAKEII